MRKVFKKICVITAAATLAMSAVGFSACDYAFTPLTDNPAADAAVSSQGGFVVQKGDYVYFINGVETYTSDNTYGTPVKGALMRAKMADIKAGDNSETQTVIPSLMVAGDYNAGIFLYGDRIYYATPNTVGNTSGTVDSSYLDFRSAKLDGSDVREYFRIADNTATYRFVEVEGTVYVLYEQNNTLHSYNTAEGVDTELARNVTAFTVNSSDKTDPYIYYTMGVTDRQDSDAPRRYNYNQIYRVRADVVEAPYTYTWDQEWLDENNRGEVPYYNLGEIVLDGIGGIEGSGDTASQFNSIITQFNHHATAENVNLWQYTYTLQSYTNDGIYFTRTQTPGTTSTSALSGALYYLSEDKINAEGWNSVTGNSVKTESADGALEMVANANDVTDASASAYFYIEEEAASNVRHHYLFVDSNGEIRRADVVNDGKGTRARIGRNDEDSLRIAKAAAGATLISLDMTSSETYDYVYYTNTSGSGLSVERAVFNGDVENYRNESFATEADKAYKSVPVLDVTHASGWYNYEVLDGVLFYANGQTFGETAYTYVWTVNLNDAEGKLMDNVALQAFNDLYDEMMGDEGYLATLTNDGNANLSTALRYFFYTGETQRFYDNIQEAVDNGRRNTYLYSEEEQNAFKAFTEGTSEDAKAKLGDNYLEKAKISRYTTRLGTMTEADVDAIAEYWHTTLRNDIVVEPEATGLPGWAWALIGVGIGVVVIGVGLTVFFLVRARKKKAGTDREELLVVDTTDDRDVDVYTQAENVGNEPAPAEAPTEEAPVEEAPVEELSAEEAPVEESVTEAPAEESAAPATDEQTDNN